MKADPLIVIGAQKCGTATLMSDLDKCRYLNVDFDSKEKSPLLMKGFSLTRKYGVRRLNCHSESVNVDISTLYTFQPTHRVPVEEIHKLLPNAKFVYLMREPLSRALSHHFHDTVLGLTKHSAEYDLHLASSYVANSLYASQLHQWLSIYPKERFLLIKFEDYIVNRRETISSICKFAGISDEGTGSIDLESVANQTTTRPAFHPIIAAFIRSPIYQIVGRNLFGGVLRNKAKARLGQSHSRARSTVSSELESHLQEAFAIDSKRLKHLLPNAPEWN